MALCPSRRPRAPLSSGCSLLEQCHFFSSIFFFMNESGLGALMCVSFSGVTEAVGRSARAFSAC